MAEKIKDYYKTLEYLYEYLDKCAELIGDSIQLHGMLKRYADNMVERYSMEQYCLATKQIESVKEKGKFSEEELEDFIMEKGIGLIAGGLFDPTQLISTGVGVVVDVMNKKAGQSAKSEQEESLEGIKCTLQNEFKTYETKLARYDADIARLRDELKSLSIFRQGRKMDIEMELDELKMDREPIVKSKMECERELDIVTSSVAEVEKYSSNIYRIVEKFD